jgi:hypothetical protein
MLGKCNYSVRGKIIGFAERITPLIYDTKIEIDVNTGNGKLYFSIKKNSTCFK